MWIIILILAVLLLVLWIRVRKIPKLGNMVLVTGGIKTGKSTLSVYMAYRVWKRNVFKWKVKCFVLKCLRKMKIEKFLNMPDPERPLLYSNIPLNVPYVPLTKDLILRNERFNYGSVCYVCECSLVADSMSFKDEDINENMLLLNKLYAHETKGGSIFYDTQSISDNHYAIRRALSTYLYVHHTVKWVPFVLFMWVRELKYSDDGSSVNTFEDDVEQTLQVIIVPKSVWKKFDCYCYSILTDSLTVRDNVVTNPPTLKAKKIISFKNYRNLYKKPKEQKKW